MSWLRRKWSFGWIGVLGRVRCPIFFSYWQVMRKAISPGLIAGRFAIAIRCAKSSGPISPRS